MITVTTIIPTYNNEGTLAQAIDSALAQTIDGHEVIVVNDGSTDGTSAIIASYGDRIRTLDHSNRGFNKSRNPAAAIARGRYLAFLDADDYWLPGRLELTCAALDRNPQAVLAFSDMIPMDDQGELGPPWIVGSAPSMNDLLTRGWRIYPSAVTMRRSTFVDCGGFSEQLTNLSDVYLWLNARELGEFEYVSKPLTIYRTVDFARIGDKYGGGRKAFVRAVRNRYGRAGRPLAAHMNRVLATSLITKALREIDEGRLVSGCKTTITAMRLSPGYFFKSGLLPRILRPRNFGRLYRATSRSLETGNGIEQDARNPDAIE
jgi:glycosyltransferase involved in cell wall biosynthesis